MRPLRLSDGITVEIEKLRYHSLQPLSSRNWIRPYFVGYQVKVVHVHRNIRRTTSMGTRDGRRHGTFPTILIS